MTIAQPRACGAGSRSRRKKQSHQGRKKRVRFAEANRVVPFVPERDSVWCARHGPSLAGAGLGYCHVSQFEEPTVCDWEYALTATVSANPVVTAATDLARMGYPPLPGTGYAVASAVVSEPRAWISSLRLAGDRAFARLALGGLSRRCSSQSSPRSPSAAFMRRYL